MPLDTPRAHVGAIDGRVRQQRKQLLDLPQREAELLRLPDEPDAFHRLTPSMIYPEVLSQVLNRIGAELGAPPTEEEATRFGRSVQDWPAFPDSGPALDYLHGVYQLIVLSNVDRESFAASETKLGVKFDAVYTAQDIGSYKPDVRNFDYLIERIGERGYAKGDILHVAQSLYHDHGPAHSRGLASAWIDRRGDQAGDGATNTPAPDVRYDFRFTSLGAFADAHRAEIAG